MSGRTKSTFAPPVMAARRWLEGHDFSALPLLNVSQAAPTEPPPAKMLDYMAKALSDDDTHLYGPVLGHMDLRSEIARQWSLAYGGTIRASQVAITSGCNQAFTAAIAALCGEGDEVILPTPFYFNHKMWLDIAGVKAVALPCAGDMIPCPKRAQALISPKTRAIVLVTPNNPCGVEYPASIMRAFYELAQTHNIALIVDETYRDFHSHTDSPHALFTLPDWDQTLIQLYSFSKVFRLTGHRVGALIGNPNRLSECEKFLDTVSICPNQLGQKAALWGLQNLSQWREEQRQEILARRTAIETHFPTLAEKGWRLLGVGAYFCYVEHPFDAPSETVAQELVARASILCLPGSMFMPKNDLSGQKQIRIAFANINKQEIVHLFSRLSKVMV